MVAVLLLIPMFVLPLMASLSLLVVPFEVGVKVAAVERLLAHNHMLMVSPLKAHLVGTLLGRLRVHVVLAVRLAMMVAGGHLHVLRIHLNLCIGYVRL